MTLAKYNTKNGSPNDRRKRRLEELRIKSAGNRENYTTRANEELVAEKDKVSE